MCLAIPAKITELKDGNLATVDIIKQFPELAGEDIPDVEEGTR